MKKKTIRALIMASFLAIIIGCSTKDNSSNEAQSKTKNNTSSVADVLDEQKNKEESTDDKKDNDKKDDDKKDKNKSNDKNKSSDNKNVDVDLSTLGKNLIYAQVYSIMTKPDEYEGKIIKMKGAFSVFKDKDTKKTYYSCIIKDATECCSQGIEFVWKGKHKYPDDYPKENDEITVVGKFNTYKEGDNLYCQLVDAELNF